MSAQPVSETPKEVLKAMAFDFGVPVTGYLICVVDQPPVLMGIVYRDSRERFGDGSSIRTSLIVQMSLVDGYALVQTIGGSTYVVVSWQASNENIFMNRIYH